MTTAVVVLSTAGSQEEAERIATALVEERLAACVNLVAPITSIYRWQGKVEEADEVAAIFKTSAAHAQLLVEAIGRLHSYEVPAVVVWPIGVAPEAYRAWVLENS